MSGTRLQHFFWFLAGYRIFILKCCPTRYNTAAGIGLLLGLNILLSGIAGYILATYSDGKFTLTATLIASLSSILMYCFVRKATTIVRKQEIGYTSILLAALAVLWVAAWSYALIIVIFRGELRIAGFLDPGSAGNLLQPFQQLWSRGEGEFAVQSMMIAITVFCSLFIGLPYLLIYHFRNSIDSQTLEIYARNFDKK